jgi:hypothetical protein
MSPAETPSSRTQTSYASLGDWHKCAKAPSNHNPESLQFLLTQLYYRKSALPHPIVRAHPNDQQNDDRDEEDCENRVAADTFSPSLVAEPKKTPTRNLIATSGTAARSPKPSISTTVLPKPVLEFGNPPFQIGQFDRRSLS